MLITFCFSESDSYDFEEGQKEEEEDAWLFDTVQNTVNHTKSHQLSPVMEGDEQQGFTIDKKHEESKDDTDRTVIPRDVSLRHGRIITEGFLSPSKPMFRKKYSE